MEIVRKLNVPVEFLFETIVKSVLSDIQSHTGRKISEKQLKGFEYNKTFGKNNKATITIEEMTKNKCYQYRTSSTKNEFIVTYQLRPLTEESCELVYIEKMESHGFIQQMNDTIVGLIWSPLKKRRFKQMLSQIEATYSRKNDQ